MYYEGPTGIDNEIIEEGSTSSSSNYLTASSGSTSNNNEIAEEDRVTIFVAYNGHWEYEGKEWVFENSKSSIMVVSKRITLSEISNFLKEQLSVDKKFNRLKLEVHYRTGSPWFPVTEIQNNEDLSVFISETLKTKLPLCVTPLRCKDEINPDDDEISSDSDELSSAVVDEERQKDDRVKRRLFKAIWKNDWVKAQEIVNTENVTWTSELDDTGFTALHHAIGGYKDNEVVRDVLKINSQLLVTTKNKYGSNPMHFAALHNNTEALKMMLDFNPIFLFIPNHFGYLPVHRALMVQAIKTFRYLFEEMKSHKDEFEKVLRGTQGYRLLGQVIDTELMDVAYELINDYPSMATQVYNDITPLDRVIRKPELFYSGMHYNLFQKFVYHFVPIENSSFANNATADVENQETPKKDKFVTKYGRRCLHDVMWKIWVKLCKTTLLHVPHIKRLKDDKVKHNTTFKLLMRICEEVDRTHTSSDIVRRYSSPFCLAVENNTAEAIDVLSTYFTELYDSEKDDQDIYLLTVLNRSEKVYSYILHDDPYAKTNILISKDGGGNNILHFAGHLAPIHKLNAASGAALQMQRELQWFEEVKRVVGIAHTRVLNKNKETPIMVFRKEHEKLRKDGEEWMKKTADSYTITAALIITIVFAAAITVPGGNDNDTGKPIYQTKSSLIIFAVSDAISLFTSTTSLLLFLSILTARYGYEEFLYKLPKRLIYGLVMLFVSVTSMMIAFGATLYIMFGQEKQWILIPIGVLACLPISSFVTLQFPLLVELISSTYGP